MRTPFANSVNSCLFENPSLPRCKVNSTFPARTLLNFACIITYTTGTCTLAPLDAPRPRRLQRASSSSLCWIGMRTPFKTFRKQAPWDGSRKLKCIYCRSFVLGGQQLPYHRPHKNNSSNSTTRTRHEEVLWYSNTAEPM